LLERSFTVDVLKVVAAQLIVWHHFAAYGPMAETMKLQWPHLLDWLYFDARQAVQVFLVVGGFLAAQSVMRTTVADPVTQILKRYIRLVPIYLLALSLICLAVALSSASIEGDWLPSSPSFWQFVAHAFLVHDLLGVEALSSGVWYVAIDFQLFVVLILLCRSLQAFGTRALSLGVALLCVVSMGWFNRVNTLDMWAIFFFAAYGLGILAAWAKRSSFDAWVFWGTALLAIVALWIEYRTRLNLALVTAIWLGIKPTSRVHWTPVRRAVQRLSNSAYVLFLTHFGVIVVFSAIWNISHLNNPVTALAMTGFGWLCAVGLGLFLHEKAEIPIHHWVALQFKLRRVAA
jgi:peptidoglycan/LPS O-acetylase OafA/YrhL